MIKLKVKILLGVILIFCFSCNSNNNGFTNESYKESNLQEIQWYKAIQPMASDKTGRLIIETRADGKYDTLPPLTPDQMSAAVNLLRGPVVKYNTVTREIIVYKDSIK